ncbi:MAG: H/ACA ribonucleoprotein complex subunit 4 [Colwellia polaris]|jgi:H/ACA ribonucleoprotein complex subunit 4
MVQWHTKEEAEPESEYGKPPHRRTAEELLEQGFVVIDKPYGPTSNQVSHWIKEELDCKKTGHFGTLDPNATGVLPVGINQGTKIADALSKARKEYIAEIELREEISEEKILTTLKEFEGTNTQTPPDKSAVKQEPRERELYEAELLEAAEEKMLVRLECESGFYVRVLAQQLGEELDTDAEMTELRRTKQGDLEISDSHTIQDVVDAYHFYAEDNDGEELENILQPIEQAVNHIKKLVIKDTAVNAVANGAELGVNGISKLQDGIKEEETVAIMTLKGELVALAEAQMNAQDIYGAEDGTAASLEKVFMNPQTYPKNWNQ